MFLNFKHRLLASWCSTCRLGLDNRILDEILSSSLMSQSHGNSKVKMSLRHGNESQVLTNLRIFWKTPPFGFKLLLLFLPPDEQPYDSHPQDEDNDHDEGLMSSSFDPLDFFSSIYNVIENTATYSWQFEIQFIGHINILYIVPRVSL